MSFSAYSSRRVACLECGYVFCRDCSQGAHLGPCLPCNPAEAGGGVGDATVSLLPGDPRAARASWVGADPSSVTIRVISKPCPGCRYTSIINLSEIEL